MCLHKQARRRERVDICTPVAPVLLDECCHLPLRLTYWMVDTALILHQENRGPRCVFRPCLAGGIISRAGSDNVFQKHLQVSVSTDHVVFKNVLCFHFNSLSEEPQPTACDTRARALFRASHTRGIMQEGPLLPVCIEFLSG